MGQQIAETINITGSVPRKNKRSLKITLFLKLMRNGFRILGRIFPTPMSILAYKLWGQTRRCSTSQGEKEILERAEYRRLSAARGGKVPKAPKCGLKFYGSKKFETYSWGNQGPKVLLVHGWNGRGSHLGLFVEPLLKAGFQVVTFDAPAHGRSPGNNQSDLIVFTDAILKTDEECGPFESVISFSVGGLCTIIALKRGLKNVRRVVCINPACHIDYILNTYFARMLGIPKNVMKKVARLFEEGYGKDLWTRFDAREYVKDYTMPALIFHDQDDKSVAFEQGATIAKLWPNASFIKTANLGHTRALKEPQVIDKVVEFVCEHGRNKSMAKETNSLASSSIV